MYGMINQAVQELVSANYGTDQWAAVKARAKCDIDYFVRNDAYPDSLTYALVGAATEVLDISSDEFLTALGEFWLLHTAQAGYAELLSASGRDLGEFLAYLPFFHQRLALLYPDFRPPRFKTSDHLEEQITLHYYSDRDGLSAMVKGILKGLTRMYKTEALIEQLACKDKGDDHDIFSVKWGKAITL